ncbi:receptor-like serine/threonine-protein kinase SD1-8 [Cucurbita moschata]|uniref:non-specific serine/threonine protein kinase n=1 Tax=Cucurbita moschata TaxID=3662 RepID=A0A6J1EMN5_CUCMO|nr:receptor-like serine/threonine-protein kinase SD1-8 [Cucurbita moschata]
MDSCLAPLLAFNLLFYLFRSAAVSDSLTPQNPYLTDGNSLVSSNGLFELGFFSPGLPSNRYLGIWYKDRRGPTSAWVANRGTPINDSSGVLAMNITTGNLTLFSHNSSIAVWSARLLRKVPNGVLQLLDTGNLVLRNSDDENPQNYSWQSFDYPSDTLLPGMKLGWDLKHNIERRLDAWRNPNDPSPGEFNWRMELHAYPETVMSKGSRKYVRHGPWNGVRLSSRPIAATPLLNFNFVANQDEVYYQYSLINKSHAVMLVMNQSDYKRTMYLWSVPERRWRVYSSLPRDTCDNYAMCGPFGYCDIRVPPFCKCLEGFKPKSPDSWKAGEFSDGCERNKVMNCGDEIGFSKLNRMKLPDTTHTWVNRSMNLEECKQTCLRNCSCMAYSNTDISHGGSGCALWIGDLIDLKLIPEAGGQDLYVRMLASELVKLRESHKTERFNLTVKISLAVVAAGSLAILFICIYMCKKRSTIKDDHENIEAQDLELPLFDLSLINSATDNFSVSNKLGEGGFGPVYKGKLTSGQEIAVKRLSQSSGQGMDEFKNEVILFAKLQHRNLVKLLGCCIEGDEKMLVYEYMPNKSLDFFIFDKTQRESLDWSQRYHIICGIARGLMYLHQDSRLRIIHRDLKPSNVLLDMDMNPKISDFGLAKTCGEDQTEGETRRVVGTYGYMAPEYAFDGQFSVKSDAFSYGILLLEIISGKRSRGFSNLNDQNLVAYAWRLWKEGNIEELIDDAVRDTCILSGVFRCVNISLLCVQQEPNDRPTMSSVVMMLGCEIPLLQPKPPGFFLENEDIAMKSVTGKDESISTNELTITLPDPRHPLLLLLLLLLHSRSIDMGSLSPPILVFNLVFYLFTSAVATDSLTAQNPYLRDGYTLVSRNGIFELGFFTPGVSGHRYLGIWFKNRRGPTSVWVANRKAPINDSSGVLVMNLTTGNLALTTHNSTAVVWSARLLRKVPNGVLQLLDTGNLALRNTDDENPQNYSWQSFVSNKDEVYYQYAVVNKSHTVMAVMNQSDYSRAMYLWSTAESRWTVHTSSPRDFCDNYAMCGPFGYCDVRVTPSCKCIEGFKPKSPDSWKAGEFADGCERIKVMNCGDEVGFAPLNQMKLPDTTHASMNRSMNLEECKQQCLRNCSCMAYANTNISGGGSGSGCGLWIGNLIDLKLIPDAGQDLYIRRLASDLVKLREPRKTGGLSPKLKIALVVIAAGLGLAIIFICLYVFKRRSTFKDDHDKIEGEDLELPLFDLSLINSATDNFSVSNKLGEGGFGPVYKGKLPNGQEIAVKRLSQSSGQGMNEFKNEVILIAKLQHRNLVKLLGCCIQGDEKMLVYEYMPNRSLDLFIFDRTQRQLLVWPQRYHIICGIARGLTYLHQDSRLRIIHRDLKPSNVLLDMDMNPKISDFGLAKTCGEDQTEGRTKRVVGTYGYMAPEYAFDGQFSVKSDAFSYGILLLEIISGTKSRGFCHLNAQNLIAYAWRLWKEGNPEELIDEAIRETCIISEVLRCINISLLCVQQRPNDRPTMSSVVMMLGCEIRLSQPKQPGFFVQNEAMGMKGDSSKEKSTSANQISISFPDPR